MRYLTATIALLAALVLPAAASAHSEFYNVTVDGSTPCGWSCTDWDNVGFTNLGCGQQAVIDPGETERVWNGGQGNNSYMHLGLGGFFNWHIHGLNNTDLTTGAETRQFDFTAYGNEGGGVTASSHALVGTRRENVNITGWGTFRVVKFVHQGGGYPVVVRANC